MTLLDEKIKFALEAINYTDATSYLDKILRTLVTEVVQNLLDHNATLIERKTSDRLDERAAALGIDLSNP
jgi:hypothetical protein